MRSAQVHGDSMERLLDTWVTAPQRPVSSTCRGACLVNIYPTGPTMGCRHTLDDKPLTLGRAEDCEIRVEEHSVSRHHARIEPRPEGYFAVDLQSTNGTFVNDGPTTMARLTDGDYLRIGNAIFRFLAGGNVEAEYHEEIYRLTIIDALTGIHNKRYLLEFLDRELVRSARHRRPLAVVMFDVDHFKGINDELGHLAGDFTLRELAATLRDAVRQEDLFARYGGDEFAMVLVETTCDGVLEVAERVRTEVERHIFQYENKNYRLTISLGAAFTEGEQGLTSASFIQKADDQLYQAKHQGRNRVVG